MDEKEYKSLIPYFCTFPHVTTFGNGDVCWGITSGYSQRIDFCRGCDYSPMAERKIKFYNSKPFDLRCKNHNW